MTSDPGPETPPARRPPARTPVDRPRTAVVVATAVAGILAGIAIFAVVLRVAGTRSVREPTTASSAFDVGPAEQRAQAIARDRTPLLFQDPLGTERDIYVQHLGGDRWAAFDARGPDAARACILRWERGPQHFVDPCQGTVYPADGAGLTSYPARVEGGRLLIDLRSPRPPEP